MTTLTERRRKKFKAEVSNTRDGMSLGVTHNGWQWYHILLNHEEMAITIKVLKQEIENNENSL